MNKRLYFATTNEGKLKEAREILKVEVEGIPLEIEEIQSMDLEKIAIDKAQKYFKKLKKPIFVEDVGFEIQALKNLPGPYISAFLKTVGNEGMLDMIKGRSDRVAVAKTAVVYIDDSGYEVFVGEIKGMISEEMKGEGFGFDAIFIPKGEKRTFGEMSLEEKNKYSMRAKALKKMKKWLEKNS